MALLDNVKFSEDVKALRIDELPILAEEIRQRIISVAYENGGHLSSNLGVVDVIVALHYVFDFPKDKLIFDVGHQCYAHKILSGRNKSFDTIRKESGLSGFPSIFESEYDAFCAGHAGNSISACLGYCTARDLKKEDYYVVDLVGDASFFNGENLEALSSSDKKPNKMIVILNDNGMSISKNNNGLYKFISLCTTRKTYSRMMRFANKAVGNNFVGRALKRIKKAVKVGINHTTAAESLGFKYVGIFDGHDIKELVKVFRSIKNADKAVVLHLKTVKGKGVKDAENNPSFYHGVSSHLQGGFSSFSSVVGKTLNEIAEENKDIVAVCAGMKDGTGLSEFAEKNPSRFFDVGIAEEHAVTYSAGLAVGGLRPIVCVYSTFLQRSYDQIMQDVCLQNLPVIFLVDRAGAVGADGATHQGLFDITYLRSLPNMSVFAPKDTVELKDIVNYCLKLGTPCAIRYPNGNNPEFDDHVSVFEHPWEIYGKGDEENVIYAVGPRMLRLALQVAKSTDKSVCVVNARVVKPIYKSIIDVFSDRNTLVLEENVLSGGFGSSVLEYLSENGYSTRCKVFAFPDKFVAHSSAERQIEDAGITTTNIIKNLI